MHLKNILGVVVLSAVAFGGFAHAQTIPAGDLVRATVSVATTTPTPGAANTYLGTVNVSALQGGDFGSIHVSSIPVTLTASNGAAIAHVTGCELVNPGGASLTSNAVVNPSGATQVYQFNSPMTLSGGSTQTLNLQCDISSAMPQGGMFTLSAGVPNLAPLLGVTLSTLGTVERGQQDATLATITLSARRSDRDITVSTLPIVFGFGGGAGSSVLSDCRIRPASDLSQTISDSLMNATVQSGTNVFAIRGVQTVPSGQMFTFALTCDVSSSAPRNATIDLSIVPSAVEARLAGTNETVTPVRGFVGNSTALGPVGGTIAISPTGAAPAPTPTPAPQPTPGVPNTGFGDSQRTLMVLAMSGLIIILGMRFLMRREA